VLRRALGVMRWAGDWAPPGSTALKGSAHRAPIAPFRGLSGPNGTRAGAPCRRCPADKRPRRSQPRCTSACAPDAACQCSSALAGQGGPHAGCARGRLEQHAALVRTTGCAASANGAGEARSSFDASDESPVRTGRPAGRERSPGPRRCCCGPHGDARVRPQGAAQEAAAPDAPEELTPLIEALERARHRANAATALREALESEARAAAP